MCFGGLPPVWSCLQVFNLGFPWGWGYVEEDLVIYKELFSWRIFGISKLFRKIILMFVQNKLVLKNSSDSHECWKILFCFWWSVCSKGFKLQFEGFKELVFKAFILLAWIMTCFTWKSKVYRSRLPAFDQKGLDWARNVGFGSWLWRKRIFRLKRCLRDFKTKDH